MSELNDLINKLCPDGVPYKKLNEVLNYEQPSKYLVSSKNYSDEYSTPVLTAGKTFILGYTDEVNGIYQASKDNPVIIFDDFTTDFKWVDFPFKAKSSGMKMLTPIDSNTCCFRYIYYAMSVIDFVPSDHKRHWISQYSNFTIPLPPLPVQSEIVRILDAFTELEAELEAELADRIEQYEYYRDYLLDKKNLEAMDGKPVEMKPMWAITTWDKKFNGVDKKQQPAINRHHYYLAKELEPLIVPNGDIKVLTTSPSDLYTTVELAKDNIKDGEIVAIPWGGNAIVQYYNGKYITSDNRIAIVNDEKQLNCKFLFYVLKNREKELAKYYRGAGIKHPDMFKVLHMEIPVPSLATQERIVDILDRFDTLTTSLTDGIPAEIAMRREQYEYFRSRLLDFPRLPDDSDSDGE